MTTVKGPSYSISGMGQTAIVHGEHYNWYSRFLWVK